MSTNFTRGDQVELCCNEEGFESSYFPATIIAQIPSTNSYIVQFNTLLGDDEEYPLREFKSAFEIRPVPSEIEVEKFELGDVVDAYANDGWWKGTVVKTGFGGRRSGGDWYHVRFERGGGSGDGEVEIGKYFVDCLRVHQDWLVGNWVSSATSDGHLADG